MTTTRPSTDPRSLDDEFASLFPGEPSSLSTLPETRIRVLLSRQIPRVFAAEARLRAERDRALILADELIRVRQVDSQAGLARKVFGVEFTSVAKQLRRFWRERKMVVDLDHRNKLTAAQIVEARDRYALGQSQNEIATALNVSRGLIQRVVRGVEKGSAL